MYLHRQITNDLIKFLNTFAIIIIIMVIIQLYIIFCFFDFQFNNTYQVEKQKKKNVESTADIKEGTFLF